MRRKSTIAWWSTSAPRRTLDGRSISGSSRPVLNQLTSPPAEKPRPLPVTIRARSGAWSASQPAASTSSPIISGLIALSASGRSSVIVPISPSTSIEIVASSGGAVAVSGLIARNSPLVPDYRLTSAGANANLCAGSERDANPNLCRVTEKRRTSGVGQPHRAAAQPPGPAGRLPVQGRPRQGDLRRQGALDPQACRRPFLRQVLARRRRDDLPGRLDRLHRHRDRGRGAAGGAVVHQAPPAEVQHPPARRQVLSLHRDQPRRGVPARLLHP